MGNGDHESDDRKQRRRQRVLTGSGIARGRAPDPEKQERDRNGVEAISASSTPSRRQGRSSQSSRRGNLKYSRRFPSHTRNATSANHA